MNTSKECKVTVKLPACWKSLIDFDALDQIEDLRDGKQRSTLDDPEPYYDDLRRVDGRFPDGTSFAIELASGQSNYFGGCTLWDKDGNEIYSETWEAFGAKLDEVALEDKTYIFEYEWVDEFFPISA